MKEIHCERGESSPSFHSPVHPKDDEDTQLDLLKVKMVYMKR
jgi:hypothetical protein